MNTRPESLELQLPHAPSPTPNSEVSCSRFFSLSGFLLCPLAPNMHLSSLWGAHLFPSLGWKLLWALRKVGRAWGKDTSGGNRGRGSAWVLGKTGLSWWVGTVIVSFLDTRRQDGFPPAASPWAAPGLEGDTGERGKEMPGTFTLLPGTSPSLLPLSLSDLRFLPYDKAASNPIFSGFQSSHPHKHIRIPPSRPFPIPPADPVVLLPDPEPLLLF